jgi:hypothetical protein
MLEIGWFILATPSQNQFLTYFVWSRMFPFLLFTLSSEFPQYRSTFYDNQPDGLDLNSSVSDFLENIGSTMYHCYVHEHQNPNTTLPPSEYLKTVLHGTCTEFTTTNYWFFKFCPFLSLTQFRYASDQITRIDQFTLAKEAAETAYSVVGRNLVADWGGGDICAVTKKPRTARIEYVCDMSSGDDGVITAISEVRFCHYLVQFHTRHACAAPNITTENLAIISCIKQTA